MCVYVRVVFVGVCVFVGCVYVVDWVGCVVGKFVGCWCVDGCGDCVGVVCVW